MSCERDFFTLKLRVNSLPLATIYEVKIPLRKWKKSLLQRNPAQMTWHNVFPILACRPTKAVQQRYFSASSLKFATLTIGKKITVQKETQSHIPLHACGSRNTTLSCVISI
jgi:hypothetical protein